MELILQLKQRFGLLVYSRQILLKWLSSGHLGRVPAMFGAYHRAVGPLQTFQGSVRLSGPLILRIDFRFETFLGFRLRGPLLQIWDSCLQIFHSAIAFSFFGWDSKRSVLISSLVFVLASNYFCRCIIQMANLVDFCICVSQDWFITSHSDGKTYFPPPQMSSLPFLWIL